MLQSSNGLWKVEKPMVKLLSLKPISGLTWGVVQTRASPQCPSGGKYIIGKLDEHPTCSLGTNVNPTHVLPQITFKAP